MKEKIYSTFYAVSFFTAWVGVGLACKSPLPTPNAITVIDTDAGVETCVRWARKNCPCFDAGAKE